MVVELSVAFLSVLALGFSWSCSAVFSSGPSSFPHFAAASAHMSDPPPSSPHHLAARQLEHSRCSMCSPEHHRTPAPSSVSSNFSVQPPASNAQEYHHLPAQLAAQLAALPPLSAPHRHARCSAPPVSINCDMDVSALTIVFHLDASTSCTLSLWCLFCWSPCCSFFPCLSLSLYASFSY